MKHILVPIDFSPASRTASMYAASLARFFGAKIHLLHVFTEPSAVAEGPSKWLDTGGEWQQQYEARINKELEVLEEQFPIVSTGIAKMGFKGSTIYDTAKELHADLIIMGRKKTHKSWLQESTMLTTIRKSGVPVLIIPEGTVFTLPRHIVLASDFDEVTNTACYELFFSLLKKFDPTVEVLHVRKKGNYLKASEVSGKLQLQHILGKISYEYQQLENLNVENALLQYIERHPADMVVMVAHLHNFLQRMFGGVHTRLMSQETPLPLLILEDK